MSPEKAPEKPPVTIKKYANRRLYHTGTSAYVTLEDLSELVRAGEEFVVVDAKTGEDLTRTVLTQIIFEQENKGQNLLPVTFLRQLIRFYGDSVQSLVPSFLDYSMNNFTRKQQELRDHMAKALGPGAFQLLEEQVRTNMTLFSDAMRMFTPFTPQRPEARPSTGNELESLKQQMAEMQAKLDALSKN